MFLHLLCLVLVLLIADSQESGPGFSSPGYVTSYGAGRYENVEVWYVGQIKTVAYNINGTGLEDYTIAIWQQDITKPSAIGGPVVNSVNLPVIEDEGSFTWAVSLYDFEIEVSPVFFFWIFNGSSSNQGTITYYNVPSAYFNISSQVPPSSIASISTTTTTYLYSSSMTRPSTATSIVSNTLLKSSSTPTESTNIAAAGSTILYTEAATQKGAHTDSPTPTSVSISNSSASRSGTHALSTGADVGIGVGVGLIVVLIVLCAVKVWDRIRDCGSGANKGTFKMFHELSATGTRDGTQYTGTQNIQALNYGRPAEIYTKEILPAELHAV